MTTETHANDTRQHAVGGGLISGLNPLHFIGVGD